MANSVSYGDIGPQLAAYSSTEMMRRVGKRVNLGAFASANDDRMKVKPIDVPCRYCKAEPGETCTRWRKRSRRRGKYKAPRTPHGDRVYDAQCASDAVAALAPEEPDTVMFHR